MNRQTMGNQELTLKVKKKYRSSKLQKQKKQNLQKLKIPKVRYNLMKEDLSEDLQNLFNNIPIVRRERTFRNITSDYIIHNIKENNISYYFKIIKESVKKTINNFKGNEIIKFKLIITCEFTSPLAFIL